MKKLALFCLILMSCSKEKRVIQNFITPFETSNGTETATYDQVINYYKDLDRVYDEIRVKAIGTTDAGKPLHMVILNADASFFFLKSKKISVYY